MSRGADIFLLAIRGTTNFADAVEGRTTHNETAGTDAGVAAARSLGDLSHKVFVAAKGAGDMAGAKPNELLILDLWNDIEGLGMFFSNPDVQKGGGRIFKSRDPGVWAHAPGFYNFDLPAPAGKNERYVGLLRGTVKSQDLAREVFTASDVKNINDARRRGQLSHHVHFGVGAPGQPGKNELLGVDVWYDLKGMAEHYQSLMGGLYEVFTAKPTTSVWEQAPGHWVEW